MVLRPCASSSRRISHSAPIPAWQAVEQTQKQAADQWWLVAQADHAALAGDLAARLNWDGIPALNEEIIRAISVHDLGWIPCDDRVYASSERSLHPLSFLDILPTDFLIAWTGSIDSAEQVGPGSGIIVSEHFCRLARNRLGSRNDSANDALLLEGFLLNESRRQQKLRARVPQSSQDLEFLTDVLQFCDLVSLYLCCGTDRPVEFPQQFHGTNVSVHSTGGAFQFTPSVFGSGVALGVSALKYPDRHLVTLPFLLA